MCHKSPSLCQTRLKEESPALCYKQTILVIGSISTRTLMSSKTKVLQLILTPGQQEGY